MKTAIMPFNYNSQTLRTIADESGNPWFVLADVCAVLEIKNPSDVLKRLDEDERARFNLGRQGEATIISESGLYAVILRSDKPQAKPFRKWVTSEVLPSIRKTGSYQTDESKPGSISIEEGKRNLARLKMAAAAVRETASMFKALRTATTSEKDRLITIAAKHGGDLSDIIEAEQNAYEADVIKYLLRKGKVSYRQFQQAKYRVRPWSEITPKSAIGETMRSTIARLEAKGVIVRQGGYLHLQDENVLPKLTIH